MDINPLWNLLPLVFSVIATFSRELPLQKLNTALSLVSLVRAVLLFLVSQIISFSRAGMSLHISANLLDKMPADCSFALVY